MFSWKCGYCGHATTITEPNFSDSWSVIETQRSKFGEIGLGHIAIACPNEDCEELTLEVRLTSVQGNVFNEYCEGVQRISEFNLLPFSHAKPQPEYIPKAIRDDYLEACLILNASPKASAAMSRRCLQGVVRDYWDIPQNKRGNLGAELNYIKESVTEDTWDAIHTIRSVGDIGAHMEKDVNTIIDVDSSEAGLLIELIETLLDDWYVERHKRRERNNRLKALGQTKLNEKKAAAKAAKEKQNP